MQRFLQQKTFRLWYVLALTVGAAIAIVAGISSQAPTIAVSVTSDNLPRPSRAGWKRPTPLFTPPTLDRVGDGRFGPPLSVRLSAIPERRPLRQLRGNPPANLLH
jgi:hypothetical protein